MAEIEYYGTGRRKTSTARIFLRPGTGAITVNRKPLEISFPTDVLRTQIKHPAPTPERCTESTAIQRHIDLALQRLSSRERTIFVLRHYHHLKLREIAETLDITEGAVKNILFRAVRRLREELAFYRAELGLKGTP